jgi:septum formation protein
MNDPRPLLLLASRSPRRAALLSSFGWAFEHVASGVDDSRMECPPGADPAAWVASLALLKARSAAVREARLDRGWLVLGADTTCVARDADGTERTLGTPHDAAEARAILRALLDATEPHRVLTGVALVSPAGHAAVFVDEARVRLGPVDAEAVDDYVASGGWAGKAGAYNLFERRDAGWPVRVVGDETTVVGLPMDRLPGWIERAQRMDA